MGHTWLLGFSLPRPEADGAKVATETTQGNIDGTRAHVGGLLSTSQRKSITGRGCRDPAALLGLVLRDLLSADQHLPRPGWGSGGSAGLMREAELKFQPSGWNSLHAPAVSAAGLTVI